MTSEFSTFAARVRDFIVASVLITARHRARKPNSEMESRNSELKNGPLSASAPFGRDLHVDCHDEEFQTLALELFELQFTRVAAYRKSCEARGITPQTIAHWSQIPALPTAAFKELELTSLPPGRRTHVFHSSGTTEQRPSRHFHGAESLAVYEVSLWTWFVRHMLPDLRFTICDLRLVSLTPPPTQAPHSSLVHMFECVRQKLGADEQAFCGRVADGDWTLDLDLTLARLRAAETSSRQLVLLSTAFSFVHLLDGLAERGVRCQLPAGSRVLETGGYKGRSRVVPKAELHELITERLGVPPAQIICEYGMSELSSQAYDAVSGARGQVSSDSARTRLRSAAAGQVTPDTARSFHFPPWARAQIISPETGREVADGETGLIRVFDLANVFSLMAIQTEDLAVRRGDGFELLGRTAAAEPRGCSLMAV
jgi:hypothetical protein